MPTGLRRGLGLWFVVTVVGAVGIWSAVHIDRRAPPEASARRWAFAALEAMRQGKPAPAAPVSASDYVAAGPVIVEAYHRGRLVRAEQGPANLADAVEQAVRELAGPSGLRGHPGMQADATPPLYFAVAIPTGTGPLLEWLPGLSTFGLVPLHEGVVATVPSQATAARRGDGGNGDGDRADQELWFSPHSVWASGLLDRAVETPIPDLSFGIDLRRLRHHIAARLGRTEAGFGGPLRRFSATTWTRHAYPGASRITRAGLAEAVREAATFLVRHQAPSGRFTYLYDARGGQPLGGYSLARHAGTAFFLAQAARELDLPSARLGARRALRWVQRKALSRCGERPCVGRRRVITMGASALTALAAAELLRGGTSDRATELLGGLTDFVRSQQRPDGELMHDYDRKRDRPIDRQHMYYSGEAAFALLRAHRVKGDPRDLETVRKLMRHLTGSGWDFFGSRYFYGEEHWTCQAAAAAAGRLEVGEGLDFCLRWLAWQGQLQYRAGQTPWPASGSYGVGPVLLPRITAIASRVEAGVPVMQAAAASGTDVAWLDAQMQRSVEALLRFRWGPGPVHLMADPGAAIGGFPGTQASFEVRNDFVQHAGSALLAWWRHTGAGRARP